MFYNIGNCPSVVNPVHGQLPGNAAAGVCVSV